MLDSLVRVSRRVAYNHYASILAEARSSVQAGRIAPGYNTPREELHSQGLYPTARTDAGLTAEECTGQNPDDQLQRKSGCKRFPFNNFTYCLTLFPKCFSSFDHSTCALSVSGQYLALDEIYHPF
jgi:hypothetical protein